MEIIIFCGPGGVGKSTLSAAMSYQKVLEGKNVLVMTVDPSLRLKTFLKENKLFSDNKSQLTVELLEPEKNFEKFVEDYLPSKEEKAKIKNNRFYKQLLTSLTGSEEFSSLYRLYKEIKSEKYDIIVLDTPPTIHAKDFLEAPKNLKNLFTDTLEKWVVETDEKKESKIGDWIKFAGNKVVQIIEKLTGSDFISEVKDFLKIVYLIRHDIKEIVDFMDLAFSSIGKFYTVSSYNQDTLNESIHFYNYLAEKYKVKNLIINRAYPYFFNPELNGIDENINNEKLKNIFCYWQDKIKFNRKRLEDLNVDYLEIPEWSHTIKIEQQLKNIVSILKSRGKNDSI
jgi:anion-transporting  ArsA/GET3 family ATPase